MANITQETWETNDTEVIIFNGKKWLNEKQIEQDLKRSNLKEITSLDLRKQRQELKQCDKQPCRRFLREDFAVQIIMDCRTTPEVDFKSRLGSKQHDPIMTQEQSFLSKIKTIFPVEKIIL